MAISVSFGQSGQIHGNSGEDYREDTDSSAMISAMLPPLLAGARARGLCDAFNLLGKAAILIDAAGMVLHANPAASALLGPELALTAGHLVARDAEFTRAIQALIGMGLAGQAAEPLLVARDNGAPMLAIRVLALPKGNDDSCQLLKAVLLLEPVRGDAA